MSRLPLWITLLAAGITASVSPDARADTLLIDRSAITTQAPVRGLTMTQVEARYGTPVQRLEPRGGQKRQWPTIHRWVYPDFTVYFERSRVIDVVVNRASPGEAGPRPPIH